MIRATVFIFALIALVGWLNGRDLAACQALGNSLETCVVVLNP